MPLETYLGVGAGAGVDAVGGWLALALKQMAGMAGAGVGVEMLGDGWDDTVGDGWYWC